MHESLRKGRIKQLEKEYSCNRTELLEGSQSKVTWSRTQSHTGEHGALEPGPGTPSSCIFGPHLMIHRGGGVDSE